MKRQVVGQAQSNVSYPPDLLRALFREQPVGLCQYRSYLNAKVEVAPVQ